MVVQRWKRDHKHMREDVHGERDRRPDSVTRHYAA